MVEIRPKSNEVVIGKAGDVFSDTLTCDHLNWMSIEGLKGKSMKVQAKIRYSHKGALCTVRELENGCVECHFSEPVRAVTPGQAVVFYEDNYVLGGGTIQ